ncbi:MAG TPA: hypothetical protein DCP92_01145 [Nitrospiraceae bacterium]|jgi:hypothetical protein|nr:hypothetical protein [Nitrospiraceae bacterium]
MEYHLNITGLFKDEEELRATVRKRKICYDTEPYFCRNEQGSLTQIGFQINLYGTFPDTDKEADLDDQEFGAVLSDVRKIAIALSKTGESLHMGEHVVPDYPSVDYSDEREGRPDVTVYIPVFDEEHFGHPVDDRISEAVSLAGKILEQAGVKNKRWHD